MYFFGSCLECDNNECFYCSYYKKYDKLNITKLKNIYQLLKLIGTNKNTINANSLLYKIRYDKKYKDLTIFMNKNDIKSKKKLYEIISCIYNIKDTDLYNIIDIMNN